jgi:signal transduction histidine kinase
MRAVRSLPRADVATALVLAVYALVEAVILGAPAAWAVAAPVVLLSLAWRRRFPVPVVAAVLALIAVPGAFTTESVDTVLPLPLIIIAGYTAGREAPTGRAATFWAAAVGAVIAAGIGSSEAENSAITDLVALLVLIGGSAGAGHVMRVRHAENRELQTLTAELAAERDRRARAAVASERARVARELHDIVAHSVSLIAVQAGAAEDLLGRDDERARRSLQAVQETARGALGEMRRLLTVLRSDDEAPGLTPQPGLAAVADLVAQTREGGIPVTLREEGVREAVPAGVDLSAYRIVQEALTNVRKHAGAVPTEVLVRYAPGELVVEVSNDDGGATPAAVNGGVGGHGLPGMRERARIYGGTLDVDRAGGRYVVRARLPLAGATA